MYEKKLYAIHYYRICKVNTVGSEHKKCSGQKYRFNVYAAEKNWCPGPGFGLET